jgi:hypothetical protein
MIAVLDSDDRLYYEGFTQMPLDNSKPIQLNFSLKWLLLGVAYAAIALTAFIQSSWLMVELLWAVAILIFNCTFLALVMSRCGSRSALGFTTFFATYVGCMLIAPGHIPSRRVLTLVGYDEAASSEEAESYRGLIRGLQADHRRNQPANKARYDALQHSYETALNVTPEVHAANAVGTMLAGLAGSLLAVFMHAKQRRRSE